MIYCDVAGCDYDAVDDLDVVTHRDDHRQARVSAFISYWQPRLGLQAWDIRLNPTRKPGKGRAADQSMQNYLLLCEIGIAEDCPDSELEACVLHELVHILTAPLSDKASAYAGALGDKRSAPVLLDELHDMEERLIEQIVTGLTGRRQLMFGKDTKKYFQVFQAA